MSKKKPILEKTVSEEETALFRAAVDGVRPVTDERFRPVHKRPSARPKRSSSDAQKKLNVDGLSTFEPAPDDVAGESLWFTRPGIQQRVARRLKRGHYPVQASLDLHGLRATEASERLAGFLADAQAQRISSVLVVHGKGRGSGGQGPVLKALLDRWLKLREEVIAFCSAQPRDGGTGAVYVLLRRQR